MSPVRPHGPSDPAADEGKTVWLDLSTPSVEATPQTIDELMDNGATLAGRYRLLNMIGEGRMSRVYKAIDLTKLEARALDPHIAVKVFTIPFVNTTDAIEALSRDIASLRSTPQPNIATLITCERDGDIIFLTMELLLGAPLEDLIAQVKSGGLPRTDALQIIKGIAGALESAHASDIVHGDLKPGNVIVTRSGQAKVIDFGMTRLMALSSGAATRMAKATGRIKALPASYASPETLEINQLDPRDDVFAMACIAWQLLTGEHPFNGRNAASARDEGVKLVCPASLTQAEFAALSRALHFERNRRTLSPRQFFAELTGAPPRSAPPWRLIAGVGALLLAIAVVAGLFVLKPRPMTLTTAPQVDTAPAELPPGATFRDCASCPLMKVVPAGHFNEGAAPDDALAQAVEQPQHSVAITYPIAVGVFEITVGQFAQFAADTNTEPQTCNVYDGAWHPSPDVSWKNAIDGQTAAFPVSCVSWQDAKRFAAWLSRLTHHLYRLPSASEWEYAARGGSNVAHPWTDTKDACNYANLADETGRMRYPGWTAQPCADNYVQSAPVGTFPPNQLGLYDMLGNVFEWVEDCWADSYAGAPTDGSARTDGDCSQRELRGGSWFTQPDSVSVSHRDRFATDYRSTSVGFRLVREIND